MKKGILLGVALVGSSLLAGCFGGGDLADSIVLQTGTCFGRVIDRSTRAGIASATVEIFAGAIPSKKDNTPKTGNNDVNFVGKTTASADDADTTLFDESGMFRITDLPTISGGVYRMRIGATTTNADGTTAITYATIQTTCTFAVGYNPNTPISVDMGDIL